MSGEEAGKLILNFQKQGAGAAEVQEMFNTGAKAARAYGLPVNQVLKDLGQSPEILARFGVANRKEFAVAAAKARSYGLSLKDINGAFGEQLDTFEGSSTAAAKLNSMFGTTINSFELMMQTDPTKRMEMLRKELLAQGKTWEKLSVFERNSITTTLGVDKATAQLMLSSEEERKKLEAKAKERERLIKVDERWNAGMGSIKKTLIAWGPLLEQLMIKAGNFIVKLFGGENGANVVRSAANAGEAAIKMISRAIDEATSQIDLYREAWYDITEHSDSGAAEDAIKLLDKRNKSLEDYAKLSQLFENKDVQDIATVKMKVDGRNDTQIKNAKDVMRALEEQKKNLDRRAVLGNKQQEDVLNSLNQVANRSGAEPAAVPKIAPSKQDAFIHKDGTVVPISDQDNILVRKSMGGENNDAVVKAIERTYRTNFKNDVKG